MRLAVRAPWCLGIVACLLSAIAAAEATAAGKSPAEVAQQVDALVAEALFDDQTEVAPRADDATFARRVWLDTVGDIPSPEALTGFLLDPREDKRQRLVAERLEHPQYGQNWGRYWRDVVFYRTTNQRRNRVGQSTSYWFTQQLNDGTGWDQIATDVITASGDVLLDGAGGLIFAQEARTEETAAEVSRVFLGLQIQCAQCHDHPWDDWSREQFHELAAFFPRVSLKQQRTATKQTYLIGSNDRPLPRAFKRRPNDNLQGVPEHFMQDLADPKATGKLTTPRFFLTGAELPTGTPDAERREQVAEWITRSDWFAKAFVNRMWSELVGEGFYAAVDDMGPDREVVAPEALGLLADEFAASGYDHRWLMRTICATEAYQRECRPRRTPDETPMTANVAQPLRGDQFFSALLSTLDIDEATVNKRTLRLENATAAGSASPRLMFREVFGFDPSVARETVSVSIPQTLTKMNGRTLNAAMSAYPNRMLGKLLMSTSDDQRLVEELYLRSLSRLPTPDEAALAIRYRETAANRSEAFGDLLWSLVNSAEFSHRR